MKKTGAADVPCNGCTLCCRKWHMVALKPEHGDDPSQYQTIVHGGIVMLAFKENGDCVYLGPEGCTIHERAPVVCKTFDCRVVFATSTRESRRMMMKTGQEEKAVYKAGRDRLDTLDMNDPGVRFLLTQRNEIAQSTLERSLDYKKRLANK